MGKREMPTKLRERQEKQRQETIEKVKKAIEDLKVEGCKVTMSNLAERTGLARATLSKPHIEDILNEKRVCKYERVKIQKDSSKKDRIDFELEIEDLKKKIYDLEKEKKNMKIKMTEVELENYKQKERIAKLLGELQLLSQKIRMHGIKIEQYSKDI